jgi:PucR family transcriptional regulator, purine catabolism regulatory protein
MALSSMLDRPISPAEASLPTIEDVITMPATQLGRPEVIAGGAHVQRRVRWLHVSELAEIDELLRGGELVLTTGIALPDSDTAWEAYVSRLVEAGASGMVLEFGRRFTEAPAALVEACTRQGIPLIVLHRPVEFVRLTEAVHTRILERQMASLRLSDRAHEVFTTLAVSGADIDEIVAAAARMSGAAVVFEDLVRHVLAYDTAGTPVGELLNSWGTRSRDAVSTERTAICGPEEWAVTAVEVDGSAVGRLVLLTPSRPTEEHLVIIERASVALTLNRLLGRDRESVHLQAQRSILADIVERRYESDDDVIARTDAIGVPLRRRMLTGVLVRSTAAGAPGGNRQNRDLARVVAEAARTSGTSVLMTPWSDGAIGVLVVLAEADQRQAVLTRLSREIRVRQASAAAARVSVGSTVTRLSDVRRSFSEAAQVDSAHRDGDDTLFHELPELGMRGLLFTLAGDSRLQAFIARTLDPILEYDAHHGTDMMRLLSAYLDSRGNKSEAARTAAMSRAAFYERLDTISRILRADLTSGEVCTSLHAAVMALDAERAARRSTRDAGLGLSEPSALDD